MGMWGSFLKSTLLYGRKQMAVRRGGGISDSLGGIPAAGVKSRLALL